MSADHCSPSAVSLDQLRSDVSPDYFKLKALGGCVGKSENDNHMLSPQLKPGNVGEEITKPKEKQSAHIFLGARPSEPNSRAG